MARKKGTAGAKMSRRTGRYVLCPGSGIKHDARLGQCFVAVYIRERAFTTCSCATRVFLPPDWTPNDGYTFEEASGMGTVLS